MSAKSSNRAQSAGGLRRSGDAVAFSRTYGAPQFHRRRRDSVKTAPCPEKKFTVDFESDFVLPEKASEFLAAMKQFPFQYERQPSKPSVGNVTWQDASIRRSSSLVKLKKPTRTPSVSSSASTADESSSRGSSRPPSRGSRPPSRGGSSCGSLDLPDEQPEARDLPGRTYEESRSSVVEKGFQWELNQYKDGKAPFSAIKSHLQRNDPQIRRSTVEAVGMRASHATMESTQAMVEGLSDSDPFVRRASVKSLCAVIAKAEDKKAATLAKSNLNEAESCARFDAIEALMSFAMEGNKRAQDAMHCFHLQDPDVSIRLKAERCLETALGCSKYKFSAIRGARVAMARAAEALSI